MLNTRVSFTQLIAIERRKLFGRALLWVELGILALLVTLAHVALVITLQKGNPGQLPPEAVAEFRRMLQWPQALDNALSFANGGELGGMLVAILVGAFVAQEYTWHTVHSWLGRGISRPLYLLAKFMVISMALLLIVLTTLVAGGAVTAVFTYVDTGTLPLNAVNGPRLLLNVLRVTFTLLPYAALTLLLAVVSRSTMVAIGVALGYSLLVENLLVEMLVLLSPTAARVARFFPTMLAKSIVRLVSRAGEVNVGLNMPTETLLLSPNTAAFILAGYTLLFLTAAIWWFRQQDVTV